MPKPINNNGLRRLVHAFGYSSKGILAALKYEAAFRQEVIFGLLLIPLSLYLHIPPLLKLILNLNWLFLMGTELLNSGIEAIVDLVSPEYNELAGRAKDMGSAAVLCLLIAWGATWLFAFAVHFQLFVC
jgi:diacylglycerol kinase (ATP)